MSDATSAAMFAQGAGMLREHRRDYLTSGGARGHILDLSPTGGKMLSTHLLLRHVGRRTGMRYISPLFYGIIGGEVAIIASKGGADHHPSWYCNLVARDEARFQIATDAFRGTWRQAEGAERKAIWAFMAGNYPTFASYQASTEREIPVILMTPVERIATFTEADAD